MPAIIVVSVLSTFPALSVVAAVFCKFTFCVYSVVFSRSAVLDYCWLVIASQWSYIRSEETLEVGKRWCTIPHSQQCARLPPPPFGQPVVAVVLAVACVSAMSSVSPVAAVAAVSLNAPGMSVNQCLLYLM